MNHSCKSQYKTIKSQLDFSEKSPKKIGNEIQINDLKTSNKNLQVEIMKKKEENVLNKNEIKKLNDGVVFPHKVKSQTAEIMNLSGQKNDYYSKLKSSYKSLQNISQELAHLEKLSLKRYNEDKDENLNKKVQFWIEIIKSDLNIPQDELIKKVVNNQTNFMKEYSKNFNNEDEKHSLDEKTKNKRVVEKIHMIKNLSAISRTKKINVNKSSKNPAPKGIFAKFQYLQNGNRNKLKLGRYNFYPRLEEIKIDNKDISKNDLLEKDYEEVNDIDFKELLDKKEQYITINTRLENDVKNVTKTKHIKYLNFEKIVKDNEKQLQDLKSQNKLLQEEISNLENVYQLTIEKERLKQKINCQNRKKRLIEDKIDKKIISSSVVINDEIINAKINNEDIKEVKNNIPKINKINKINNNRILNKNRSGYFEDNTYNMNSNFIEARKLRLKRIREKYLGDNNSNKNNIDENNVNEISNEKQYENEQLKSENEEYLNNIEKELNSGNLLLGEE